MHLGYPHALSTQWKTYTRVIFEYQPCIFEAGNPFLSSNDSMRLSLPEHRMNLIRISPGLSPSVDNFSRFRWKIVETSCLLRHAYL